MSSPLIPPQSPSPPPTLTPPSRRPIRIHTGGGSGDHHNLAASTSPESFTPLSSISASSSKFQRQHRSPSLQLVHQHSTSLHSLSSPVTPIQVNVELDDVILMSKTQRADSHSTISRSGEINQNNNNGRPGSGLGVSGHDSTNMSTQLQPPGSTRTTTAHGSRATSFSTMNQLAIRSTLPPSISASASSPTQSTSVSTSTSTAQTPSPHQTSRNYSTQMAGSGMYNKNESSSAPPSSYGPTPTTGLVQHQIQMSPLFGSASHSLENQQPSAPTTPKQHPQRLSISVQTAPAPASPYQQPASASLASGDFPQPSPPRMFVHHNGETTSGRSDQFEKVLEASERRAIERMSISQGGGTEAKEPQSPRTLFYSKITEALGNSSDLGIDSIPPSPVSPQSPIDTDVGSGGGTTDWATVHARNNSNGLKRSLSNNQTTISFDVRHGGGPAHSVNVLIPDTTPSFVSMPPTLRQTSSLQLEASTISSQTPSSAYPPPPLPTSQDPHSFKPFTLAFDSYPLECEYRFMVLSYGTGQQIGLTSSEARAGKDLRQLLCGFVALAALFFATLGPAAWNMHWSSTPDRNRVILQIIGGLIYIIIFAINRFKKAYKHWVSPVTGSHNRAHSNGMGKRSFGQQSYASHSQGSTGSMSFTESVNDSASERRLARFLSLQSILAVLFCISGCCWSAGSVIHNDSLHRLTQAVPTILFLAIGFLILDVFLFSQLVVTSWIITIQYFVLAIIYRDSDSENWVSTISKCIFVLAATCILCYSAYYNELHVRLSFLKQKQLTTTKKALQKETAELRNEVFSLVLEKFDIVDVSGPTDKDKDKESGLDLSTPLEKSMKLLQQLERDKSLSKTHFDMIRTIIEQLGSSNDNIFRPRMSQIVGSATKSGYFRHARGSVNSGGRRHSTGGLGDGEGTTGFFEKMRGFSNGSHRDLNIAGSNLSVSRSTDYGMNAYGPNGSGTSPPGSGRLRNQLTLDEDTTKWLSSLVDDPLDAQDSLPQGDTSGGVPASPMLKRMASPSGLSNLLSSEEEQTIYVLTDQLTDWNFDVFEVCKLTKNRPLFFLGLVLFRKNDLINKFGIDKQVLCNFLNVIENGYNNDLPYHNSTHASDVTRSMHFFLHKGGLKNDLNDLEILASLIASLMHDFQHPGVNNNFLMKSHHELSLIYNDKSILENMHLSSFFKELSKPENNILANLSSSQYDSLRKLVIEMVLATDLGQHFEIVGHFKNALPRLLTSTDRTTDTGKLMILKMALKCCDIAHSAKSLALHTKWSLRIIEEFYRQGDQELSAGLAISPFMDRRVPNVSKAQLGFIDFLALPMFTLWSEYLGLPNEQIPCLIQLKANREHWNRQT